MFSWLGEWLAVTVQADTGVTVSSAQVNAPKMSVLISEPSARTKH